MVLKRPDLCGLLGISSWTAIQVWLGEVVTPAYTELINDYLRGFESSGDRNPIGDKAIKECFVRHAQQMENMVEQRVSEMQNGIQLIFDKARWISRNHYEHFIVEAVALDRIAERKEPQHYYIANKAWARDPVKLFGNMFELTDTLCYNWWKTAETELWASDDSDVPFTNAEDVPGHAGQA
ncbi:hypothetical protein N0V88_004878 [Collariella sp. IMI 366227]|nr:hypothetical protein N0V88_004878 [Collariella sp. IMI 366227]